MPQCLFIITVAFFLVTIASSVGAQSTDIDFPTPLTMSVVSGIVKARAIGDARETTYYFAFEGDQGDVFVNVSTKNFAGSIDVFSADTVRTFTRIPIFADSSVAETGRIIYLRKREKLLLRVQGRTPDDNPATFQVKFAGSFVAISNPREDATAVPKISNDSAALLRGAPITRSVEEPIPSPPLIEDVVVSEKKEAEATPESNKPEPPAATTASPGNTRRRRRTGTKPSVVVTNPVRAQTETARRAAPRRLPRARTTPAREPNPDPLANVRLLIVFKNGEVLERPLPEVLRFTVDKGVLVVIGKDGTIRRYPMIDVAKVTIE